MFLPLGEGGGWRGDVAGDGVEEDDTPGDGGGAEEFLLFVGSIGPAGAEELDIVAVRGPGAVPAAFERDGAGADADDIVVEVDDGAGGEGLDFDGAGGVAGFLLGFDGGDIECAGGGAAGEEGKEEEDEAEEHGEAVGEAFFDFAANDPRQGECAGDPEPCGPAFEGAVGGPGAEDGEEEPGEVGKDFHSVRSITSPCQPCGSSHSGELRIHQRRVRMRERQCGHSPRCEEGAAWGR